MFYAKTINVDVPYVFWFVMSCLFLVEALRDGRARDCIGFGIAAAAAVGTKDQAYALYVLPALYLAWRLGRSRQGVAALAAGTVAGLVTLILIFNLPFNYEGFRAHVDLVLGPASEGYRMFPPTAAGEWVLAKVTAGQLLWTLGVPGTILVVRIGLLRRGRARPADAGRPGLGVSRRGVVLRHAHRRDRLRLRPVPAAGDDGARARGGNRDAEAGGRGQDLGFRFACSEAK